MNAGDMSRASAVAEEAAAAGVEDAQLLTLAAYRNLHGGNPERAYHFANRACELAPANLDALNAAASALHRMGRSEESAAYFERALELAPDDVELLINAAGVFDHLRRAQRACDLLEHACQRDPRRADATARLAFICANRGDMQKARAFGVAALALDNTQAFASFAVAIADIDEGKFEAAIAELRAVTAIPRVGRVICAIADSIQGDALDRLQRYEEAFAAYSRSGEALKMLYGPPPGEQVETALARSKRLAAYVSRAPAESWNAAPGQSPVRSHVFLLGFPRSGTTLLTHILDSHPDITALDEPRTLTESAELVASDAALDRLASLSDDDLALYRAAYWRRAASAGFEGGTNVLVEKVPLYSEILCLIAKLFPEAKIVFAIRDPRDIVLSCFRRRFSFTPQMYELNTLEGAAVYYDATMQLLELYRSKLALPLYEIHHENLVADFARETTALCNFIGAAPDVALGRYAERLGGRNITSPNAPQIARGIQQEALGQWRSYANQMKPVMSLLERWIETFGYPQD